MPSGAVSHDFSLLTLRRCAARLVDDVRKDPVSQVSFLLDSRGNTWLCRLHVVSDGFHEFDVAVRRQTFPAFAPSCDSCHLFLGNGTMKPSTYLAYDSLGCYCAPCRAMNSRIVDTSRGGRCVARGRCVRRPTRSWVSCCGPLHPPSNGVDFVHGHPATIDHARAGGARNSRTNHNTARTTKEPGASSTRALHAPSYELREP